jgi:hypothetical protein
MKKREIKKKKKFGEATERHHTDCTDIPSVTATNVQGSVHTFFSLR